MPRMRRPVRVVGQQVPDDFARILRQARSERNPRLDELLWVAWEVGWTAAALGEALGVSYQAVRYRVGRVAGPVLDIVVPTPPPRPRTVRQSEAARRRPPREPPSCGTRAAYSWHLRNDEEACEDCLRANADDHRDARVAHNRARQRAMAKLKQAHPKKLEELFAAEQRRERGLLDHAAKKRAMQRALGALARAYPKEWKLLLAAEKRREADRNPTPGKEG